MAKPKFYEFEVSGHLSSDASRRFMGTFTAKAESQVYGIVEKAYKKKGEFSVHIEKITNKGLVE